ncbi:polysaccharide biosynthesis protein, partial [Acinetobacter baumannii]|uniref:polysaccharide biosynthesis protein n=1 Tax=Acinetobacter baumannii TaxID=470 RepID=UPI003AFA2027
SDVYKRQVMVAKSRNLEGLDTVICGTRYGNVMASRGSVIPLFVDQMRKGKPLTITDPNMTRFMMTLEDAVDLVLYAFEHGENGDIFVQKAPAATIEVLAQALKELLNQKDYPITIMGTRHGEKAYEALLSREEMAVAIDQG